MGLLTKLFGPAPESMNDCEARRTECLVSEAQEADRVARHVEETRRQWATELAATTAALPAMGSTSACRKCGGTVFRSQYQPQFESRIVGTETRNGRLQAYHGWAGKAAQAEAVVRRCLGCDFEWLERPLDFVSDEDRDAKLASVIRIEGKTKPQGNQS